MKAYSIPPLRNGHSTKEKHLNGIKRKRCEQHSSLQREVKRICARVDNELREAHKGSHEHLKPKYEKIETKLQNKESEFKQNHSNELKLLELQRVVDKNAIEFEHIRDIEKLRENVSKKFEESKRHNLQFRDQKTIMNTPLGCESSERNLMRKQIHELFNGFRDPKLQKKLKIGFTDVESQVESIYSAIQEDHSAHSQLITSRSAFTYFPAVKTRDAYFHYCNHEFKLFDKVIFKRRSIQSVGVITSITSCHFLIRCGEELMMIKFKDLLYSGHCHLTRCAPVNQNRPRYTMNGARPMAIQSNYVFSPPSTRVH